MLDPWSIHFFQIFLPDFQSPMADENILSGSPTVKLSEAAERMLLQKPHLQSEEIFRGYILPAAFGWGCLLLIFMSSKACNRNTAFDWRVLKLQVLGGGSTMPAWRSFPSTNTFGQRHAARCFSGATEEGAMLPTGRRIRRVQLRPPQSSPFGASLAPH